MPTAVINLISKEQIHQESLQRLEITIQRIRICDNMLARLVGNNLYLMDIPSPGQIALATINKDTLKIWHFRLGHLGHQNIIRLANMYQLSDLSEPSPQNICIPCTEANMRVKPHIDMIQPCLQPLDLVHSNISELHTTGLYGARYYIIFLFDVI